MEIRIAQFIEYEKLGGLGKWDSGILEINLSSWDEFSFEIERLLELGDFIWRGQKCDWPLKSKFDRIVNANREVCLKEHEASFRRSIKGRRGSNPSDLSTDDLWSLGQHYGLATPLLDWTESPFVAAYFAFLEKDFPAGSKESITDASQRFIYALSKDFERWGPRNPKDGKPSGSYTKFVEPVLDDNPRLINQRGLFTLSMSEIDIEERVRKCYKDDPRKGRSRIIFVRIKMNGSERYKILRNLNRMNINHATLFPDLIGASEYCNVGLEIENFF